MAAIEATQPSGSGLGAQPTRARAPRWRKWLRRGLSVLLSVLLVLAFIAWWFVLRIVKHDSWPPPPDAVTSGQAQAATEEFLSRDDVNIPDLGIPLAPSTTASVQFYSDGTQFFPPMGDDMAAAKSSIHILMFTMTPGEVSDRVVSILKQQVAAGVEVRMIVDRYGAKVNDRSKPIFDELTAIGVEVVVNDIFPLDRDGLLGDRSIDPRQDEVGNADHRKMLVIDGKVGWIGGAGFEDHFFDGSYHDAYVRVTGDVVRQMQLVFLTSFHALGGPPPAAGLDRFFPVPDAPGTIPATLLQNVPGGFLPGTQAIGEMIEQAQGRLDILNPYMTDPDMVDRIIDAGERGVDVTLDLPGDSNVTQARDAAQHNYGDLFDAGVQVYEHETIIHAKVVVADDRVVIGTINFDSWALYRNHEIAILFDDAGVADHARRILVADAISRSEPAELPEGRWDRLKDWFWDKLVYFI
jgi:cardiolipin synthase